MSAIRKFLGDFIAIVALIVISILVGGYIIYQQDARGRIPLVEGSPFVIKAEFSDAQAVTPGQGQTVRVAGVEVGKIGKVELEEGKAIVALNLDPKHKALVRRDATALLRPRTGLKDMFVELDPGSRSEVALRANERIPVSNTAPDIDPDEFFSALDADTRDYLKLLVSGLGKGLKGRGNDLRETFKRFEPLHRDLAEVNTAIAERRQKLKRLVSNYASLTNELGDNDDELARLVSASNQVFDAFAKEDQNVSETVRRLPPAFNETSRTLTKVQRYGDVLGPALESLRPAFRELDEANREVLPLVREARPIIRDEIRPFVREARPFIRDLRPAARDLARANPDFADGFTEFNRFFNIAAFNPGGREELSGNLAQDLRRDEGYLFWLAWTANNGNSLFSTGDASGPFRRGVLLLSCASLQELLSQTPAAETVIGFTGLLESGKGCSRAGD